MAASAKFKRQFILFLLVLWLGIAGTYAWFFIGWLDHRDWKKTAATIDSVSLAEPPFGHGECQNAQRHSDSEILMVVVVYTFEVDGHPYTSDQFTRGLRGDIECSRADANESKARYENAKRITVYYDPGNPKRSVVRLPNGAVIYIFGVVLALVLGGLGFAFLRAGRKDTSGAA